MSHNYDDDDIIMFGRTAKSEFFSACQMLHVMFNQHYYQSLIDQTSGGNNIYYYDFGDFCLHHQCKIKNDSIE